MLTLLVFVLEQLIPRSSPVIMDSVRLLGSTAVQQLWAAEFCVCGHCPGLPSWHWCHLLCHLLCALIAGGICCQLSLSSQSSLGVVAAEFQGILIWMIELSKGQRLQTLAGEGRMVLCWRRIDVGGMLGRNPSL